MARIAIVIYGTLAYVAFVGAILYLVGFLGDVFVPKSVDRPSELAETGSTAFAINLALIAGFGLQHSIMARRSFKSRLVRLLPAEVERSTFVLATAIVFGLIFWLWVPMPARVWAIEMPLVAVGLQMLFWAGWGLVPLQ